MTEVVRGADVHLAGSVILRSGRVPRGVAIFSRIYAFMRGIIAPVKAFFFVWACSQASFDVDEK
jgi:hypothetical protein